MIYKQLKDLVKSVNIKNTDGKVKRVIGVSISKNFIPSVANLNGVDLTKYNLIKKNQFACKLMSVGRDLQLPIDLYKEESLALISSAYYVFEVINENIILPDYLNMWFRRSETDRWVGYISGGDVRGGISWEMFLEMKVNVPPIEEQRQIVAQYQSIANKIKVNEQICEKLEAVAQALYKHWFVDFDFPYSLPSEGGPQDGVAIEKPYKSSGGKMVWNEELGKEIPEGWEVGKLKNIIYYSNTKISLRELTSQNYISTESMLADKRGVDFISNVPEGNNVSEFIEGDILISNIRPYLKKIWFADINGGCSNDVLCLRSKEPVFQFFALNILFNDQFFDYVMQGAKGTKMPRGDKDWILDYKILLPSVSVLEFYSKEIQLVNKVKKLKTKQNQKLTQLQSLLLSRLAVGEEVEAS
ncbi:restriction endonuclease subunit S [Chryseobacterium sp. C3]|uniref:restriction endonuclease subunit S n=1 Tax=Chryseobacterium sp. C3 TaxID=2761532 RepID=UPI001623A532|nr:restriction endonuclease subunit S [Chryseobacterium sp. C3]